MRHDRSRSLGTPIAVLVLLGVAPAAHAGGELSSTPRGSYVRIERPPQLAAPTPVVESGTPHILFLNRCAGGETIYPGYDDSTTNHSSILGGQVTFPEYPYGDGSWSVVMEKSRELFSPFNIQVTDVDPSPAAHDEVIVCGNAEQAGFAGAGGVAPFDCSIIPNPITYVFAETMGNQPEAIAIVIGQEAAHAWGLDHEYQCNDPMTYLNWCGDVAYQQGDYSCGEYEPRACSCGGNTQNSYQHILDAFGPSTPDTAAPLATITSPQDGAQFDAGAEFMIAVDVSDDVQVTSVTLYVNGESQGADNSEPFGPWPALDTPEGTYELYVEATDFAGNVGTSDVVTVHVGLDPGGGGDGGSDGGGGGESGADGGGGDDGTDDGAADGGGGDGAGLGGNGALPPGFGANRDQTAGCAMSDRSAAVWLLLPLLGVARLRRRRR
ncbi:MAG: Ig-like domain-containing protein [Nannocystaceae bacterium]